MSDNSPFVLIITEGAHDVEAISRILKLKGFCRLSKYDEIPKGLASIIPRQYPTGKSGILTRLVPHPTFLERNGNYMVVSNANGKTQLGENLSNLIGVLSMESLSKLLGIAIIADIDQDSSKDCQRKIIQQIQDNDPTLTINMNNLLDGELLKDENRFPLHLFLLPDNNSPGTLEFLLLAGAEQQYNELLQEAYNYIDSAKNHYSKQLNGFNDKKATVGVVANVLRPGKANQVSIGEDKWFTTESLHSIPLHIKFGLFIEMMCRLFEADP